MSDAWTVIAVLAVVNFAIKATGPLIAGRRELPRTFQRLIDASVAGLVAALIVTGTFAAGQELVLDERAGGVVAAVVAILAKLPMLLVLVAAAGTTALLRAV
jgi:branched-subunit amino acid transport protein